jgi:hypothetical protein
LVYQYEKFHHIFCLNENNNYVSTENDTIRIALVLAKTNVMVRGNL